MSKNNKTITSVVKQQKQVSGLFTCTLEHQVVDTKADFKWEGPRIDPAEWDKVLAFFQWTYDNHHSECQVRGFLHKTEGWRFWAFPQEARTGMSAREFDSGPEYEKSKEQRAQFNDDWMYFCTAHHHNNANAFQSGVDEANEKNQDGLHITVGDLGGKSYSLHDRFYLGGNLINHDLSWFWDIGEALQDVPVWTKKFLPTDISDRLARGQMTRKVAKDAPFPEQWKANLMVPEPTKIIVPAHYQGGLGYQMYSGRCNAEKHLPYNINFDLRLARLQLIEIAKEHGFTEQGLVGNIGKILSNDPLLVKLTQVLYANDVSLTALHEYMANNANAPAQNGVPDYDGPNYAQEGASWNATGTLPQ